MQDPSYGVVPQLQSHVHLISGHRFPLLPQLTIEQAFRYLLDAPTIVKQTAPMAWTYVTAPQDGTLWLEWISPRNEFRFPSDGYVWGDPEASYQQDFGGYTIEILRHSVGFRPGFDQQLATHARTRYHFRTKNPNVNAAHPDSHLWIVHYHQTDQNHMLPIQSLQLQGLMRQILAERKWLESLGRLERKDFMLHDREHWPQINLPGSAPQQPGMYGNPMVQQQINQQRFPQYPYGQGQGPPAKRPRHSGPTGLPGSADGVPDTIIEDEDTSLGDFFDHLSPREISLARYMQHHRWMEEVFSSPYASSQIVPPDLGLGLMGELKGLTEGILDPPSAEELGKALEKPGQAKEARPFTNLKKEQVDEFNKRVEKHLEEGRAEIERMKNEHAEKMAEWKKTKTLMQAEKRLRQATWEGRESAVPVYRLDVSSSNGHMEENVSTETVEDIVKNVESVLGVRIASHKESTLIEKGGLDEDQSRGEPDQEDSTDMDGQMSAMQQQQEPMMSGANNLDPAPQSSYQQQLPQGTQYAGQTQALTAASYGPQTSHQHDDQQDQQDESIGDDEAGDMGQSAIDDMVDMGDTSLMEDMDMDVDGGDIDFINDDQTPGDDLGDASMFTNPDGSASTPQQQQEQPANTAEASGMPGPSTADPERAASPVTLGETGEQVAPAPDQSLPPTTTAPFPSAGETATVDTSTTIPAPAAVGDLGENAPGLEGAATATGVTDAAGLGAVGVEGEESVENNDLFDDGTFDDLANMEGEGGENGLIDFDGGMGLDDSAFGDAMHGMDSTTPMGNEGEGDGGHRRV